MHFAVSIAEAEPPGENAKARLYSWIFVLGHPNFDGGDWTILVPTKTPEHAAAVARNCFRSVATGHTAPLHKRWTARCLRCKVWLLCGSFGPVPLPCCLAALPLGASDFAHCVVAWPHLLHRCPGPALRLPLECEGR